VAGQPPTAGCGGGRRRTPLCGSPLFAKRALWLAACRAEGQGETAVAPEHLLYGVLRDLDGPYGASNNKATSNLR